jgi:hypothetical protein
MAAAKSPEAPKTATNGPTNIKNLTWHHVQPPGCQRPGPRYATSGVFCYEETIDNDGKPHFRRALWSKILENAEDPKSYLNYPSGIWSPVNA